MAAASWRFLRRTAVARLPPRRDPACRRLGTLHAWSNAVTLVWCSGRGNDPFGRWRGCCARTGVLVFSSSGFFRGFFGDVWPCTSPAAPASATASGALCDPSSVCAACRSDLGCHVDGYIAVVAHTLVVPKEGATPTDAPAPVSAKAADVIVGAYTAAEAALRMLRPGNKVRNRVWWVSPPALVESATPRVGAIDPGGTKCSGSRA